MNLVKTSRSGFTLLELIVSISIMAIISGMLLLSYVNQNVLKIVEQNATEFALTAREAQVYALGNKEFKASNIFPGYGIYINPQENKYTFFGDLRTLNEFDGDDNVCTADVEDECLRVETFLSAYHLQEVCINGGACSTDPVTVVFPAHSLTPKVNGNDAYVEIHFTNDRNSEFRRKVTIYTTGYIEMGTY